jgi:hypothetical protein
MIEDLLKQQNELQHEAQQVLDRLEIEKYFSQFGRVEIGGSVVTGLMTWRDIDVGVLVNALPDRDTLVEVAKHILTFSEIVGVNITDNTKKKNPNHPSGLYIGLTYLFEAENKWKIDLWFITPEAYPDTSYTAWLKDSLTPESTQVILEIKNDIHANPKYKKTIFSIDVYEAVIKHGVTDLAGFKAYLKESEREL